MARVNPDGSLDPDFDPNVDFYGTVNSMALQADGKIVIAGNFSWVGPGFRNGVARIYPDGSPDGTFQPSPSGGALTVALQADGKVLVGGGFTGINGTPLTGIARIENDPATQSFAMPAGTAIQWWRGGAAPEAQRITFEYSNDGGDTWSLLGAADRVPGGWEKTGLILPMAGKIRARGYVSGGNNNGGLGLVETSFSYVNAPEIAVEQPVGTPIVNAHSKDFGNVVKGVSSSRTFTIRNLGVADLMGLTITKSGDAESFFTVTPDTLSPISGPDGSATFTVEFKPLSVGLKTATVHIASNDPDEGDYEINLTGTGVLPPPTIRGLTFDVAFQFDGVNHMQGTLETTQTGTFNTKGAVEDFFNTSTFSVKSMVGETEIYTWNNANAAWSLHLESLDLPGNQEVAVISSAESLTIDFTTPNENSDAELRLREGATSNLWQVLRQNNNVSDQNYSILQSGMPGGPSQQLPYDSKLIFQSLNKPDGISGTIANLHAHVNPNGSGSSVTFNYGTDPTLSSSIESDVQAIGSGNDYVAVHQLLTGLQPETTYYYRATAHYGGGDVDGPILSFTTKAYSPAEAWRLNYFGFPGNTGEASDNAMPKKDGIANIIKFATGMNPTQSGTMPGIATRGTDVNTFTFTYHRSKAAVAAGISFVVEWSDTLLPDSWSSSQVSETFVDQGITDLVTATIPAGSAGHRFVRLRVAGS